MFIALFIKFTEIAWLIFFYLIGFLLIKSYLINQYINYNLWEEYN